MKLSINQCKAFASKVDEDGQKRVMIFSTVTGENGRESSLESMRGLPFTVLLYSKEI